MITVWILMIWMRGGYQIGSVTEGPAYSDYESCDQQAKILQNANLNAICIKAPAQGKQ